jgi:glycosyltransferase involved in cell wall biosynthesis
LAGKRIVIFGWAHSVHIQRWVSGLAKRGYRIKVVSLDGPSLPDVDTCILPRRGRWSYLTQAAAAAKEARAFSPHLIHVHYAGGFGLWGMRTRIKPLLISVWGSDLIGYRPRWLYRAFLRSMLKRATHITATGEWLKKSTCELLPEAAARLSIIPFGVEIPDKINPPLSAKPIRLCFIKGHHFKYGPDVLLKALADVKKEISDIILSMAGSGEMTTRLETMASNLDLQKNVQFVGFVSPDQMYPFLQQHHIMVMPSRTESFGVAALEASACGRPVIASRVGGVPEVVLHRKTGILVPPKDPQKLAEAIINLAQDAKTREEMGQAGYRFVKENYSWEKSLDMMGELYERLIHEAAKRT